MNQQDLFITHIIDPILYSLRHFGNRNAFCINDKFYTYNELGTSILKIKNCLLKLNTKLKLFGLVINDDLETYAAIVALWLEGKSFVPIHPLYTKERGLKVVELAAVEYILDSSQISWFDNKIVIDTQILEDTAVQRLDNIEVPNFDLAYVLFTSGTTGEPKGVKISRENLGAFIESFWQTGISIFEEDRCLQCFDLTFDVAIQSFLVALVKGACVYTIPQKEIKYLYVSRLIEKYKLTFITLPPSLLRYLQPYFCEIDASSLKTCIITAEACPLTLVEEWFKCAVNSEIFNFYGPTEATVYCTFYKLKRESKNKALNGIVSIGKPISNVSAIIADENGLPLAPGIKGELLVSGKQISSGYWNDPEKNKVSFIDINKEGQVKRYYRTGDFCYQDKDFDFMFSGRIDNQVKVQGYRIELSEIEFHVQEFCKTSHVYSTIYETKEKITELALFIESEPFETLELYKHLQSKLPPYMIPKKILFEPKFPLNNNLKIDKNIMKSLLWKEK